jgi:hypothetical protein
LGSNPLAAAKRAAAGPIALWISGQLSGVTNHTGVAAGSGGAKRCDKRKTLG